MDSTPTPVQHDGAGKLAGRVALVTGVGHGLGAATLELFAREGATVVGCCRTAEDGQATLARVTEAGGRGLFVRADVAESRDVRHLIDTTLERFGRLDVVVNNAAIGMSSRFHTGAICEIPDEDFDEVVRVNLGSVFRVCKYAIPPMIEGGGGVIVNISSTSSVVGFPQNHNYSAAKAGVNSLTQSIAVRYGPEGIRANCIVMGGVDTPMIASLMPVWNEVMKDDAQRFQVNPMGRISQPEEMAKSLLFAASDDSSFMNGASIAIDGGQVIAPVAHIPGIEHPEDSR